MAEGREYDVYGLRAFLGLAPPRSRETDTGTVVPLSNIRNVVVFGQDFLGDTRKLFKLVREIPCKVRGWVVTPHITSNVSQEVQDTIGRAMHK